MIKFLKLLQFKQKNSSDEIINSQNNKYNIIFSENSYIRMPSKISGGNFIKIGKSSVIGHNSWIATFDKYFEQNFSPNIEIGDNVSIGNFACLTAIDSIKIHDGCLFSEHVYVTDHFHGSDPSSGKRPLLQPLFSKGPVEIGENTFIGYRVTVLSGVKIGKNCVIGAHSVVNKTIPDNCMVVGSPAKIIKRFNFENKEWENEIS